ncbi:hypothetical protein ACFWY5_51265 [Nonomuraea sp. NPDC059007]|uniref:hypothetical protein n=1 Tax=Nonomuraea sp. NPDC059007 TaxID=3346692 RepID=UPI0036852764
MINPFNRRGLIAGLGLLGGFGLLSLSARGAEANSASAKLLLPVGTWAVTITLDDGTTERGLFGFSVDGMLIQTNTGSRFCGVGSWRPQPPNGFVYGFRSQAFDDSGFIFELRIKHEATFSSPSAFTSTGTGTSYAPDGSVLFVSPSRVTGQRYAID